eukprot:60423-Amphidinium_carterae.1
MQCQSLFERGACCSQVVVVHGDTLTMCNVIFEMHSEKKSLGVMVDSVAGGPKMRHINPRRSCTRADRMLQVPTGFSQLDTKGVLLSVPLCMWSAYRWQHASPQTAWTAMTSQAWLCRSMHVHGSTSTCTATITINMNHTKF